jgi:hypothetical protein
VIKVSDHLPITMTVDSVRQAAAVCNVSPVVRRWLSLGLIPGPPWTPEQLHEVRDLTDPEGRRPGNRAAHGTITAPSRGGMPGYSCAQCREFESDKVRARGRRKAQERLPAQVRQQLLNAIHDRRPFRQALRELDLTSNQVWGLAGTDREWSTALDAALTSSRRDDLKHGTNAAYVQGCVCKECREHQRQRMARNR